MKNLILFLFFVVASSPIDARPSTLVYNLNSNRVEHSENSDQVRPMASITKLMTAMVTLERFSLESGNTKTLLEKLLIRSDNSAAEILAKKYPGGRSAFISRMNTKAKELGLDQTRFEDPSGIGAGNVTTATELVEIIRASGKFPAIRDIASRPEINLPVMIRKSDKNKKSEKKKKNKTYTHQVVKEVTLPNTNHSIMFEFSEVAISKTGTTSRAGKCLAMLVKKEDQEYAVVILGEPNKQARDRTARNLIIKEVKLKEM
jgi:D-alanyl-D-alanine endopeptidase (penicillin-binding protein 7)